MNPVRQAYLRELAIEFNASPSHIKEELDQLTAANLLIKEKSGRQLLFSANRNHPIYTELHSMVSKTLGMDEILESIIKRLGNLKEAYLVNVYAEGKDTGIIDLVLIGRINQSNLNDLVNKTEKYIARKIRTLILTEREWRALYKEMRAKPLLLLWKVNSNKTEFKMD